MHVVEDSQESVSLGMGRSKKVIAGIAMAGITLVIASIFAYGIIRRRHEIKRTAMLDVLQKAAIEENASQIESERRKKEEEQDVLEAKVAQLRTSILKEEDPAKRAVLEAQRDHLRKAALDRAIIRAKMPKTTRPPAAPVWEPEGGWNLEGEGRAFKCGVRARD